MVPVPNPHLDAIADADCLETTSRMCMLTILREMPTAFFFRPKHRTQPRVGPKTSDKAPSLPIGTLP